MSFFDCLPQPCCPPFYLLSAWVVILLSCICGVAAVNANAADLVSNPGLLAVVMLAVLLVVAPEAIGYGPPPRKKQRKPTISRTRRNVSTIMRELGESYVRRSYRMKEDSFWTLHQLLEAKIKEISSTGTSRPTSSIGDRNGLISSSLRLSIAIRYFSGACLKDISIAHGVSKSEVLNSVWIVVDSVNQCDALKFGFPRDHAEQRRLARGFSKKSKAEFTTCVGATDGMLIWTKMPTESDCQQTSCGPMAFYCDRRKKFGLNMQATCDAKGRFLDFSIGHPAANSDFLAFMTSPLKLLVEKEGFLAPGLVLFGDNAYVNSSYMATPFEDVSGGAQHAYNFYHSQLRISIECTFGVFVHRWGILRKPIPENISIAKTCALVCCLCRLHNFCVNMKEGKADPSTAVDELNISLEGGVAFDKRGIPKELLGGSGDDQFDDNTGVVGLLPRDLLLAIVSDITDKDRRRPPPPPIGNQGM